MNYELNQAKLKINPNLQKKENQLLTDQTNKSIELSNFIHEYSCDNNNIIPKLFFSLIENESLCHGCNIHKYNYQIIFSLEMPLEYIYNKIYGNKNIIQNSRKLNLIECISNYNEKSNFTGGNAMYCNVCQKQMNSIYTKSLHSLSPYLIIILNRGKGNKFQCDVDFPEEINLQQYILNPQINYLYKINGYKNGVPYILFYESKQGDKNILFDLNGNNNMNMNINNNMYNNIYINNMMYGNNQMQNFQINNMPMINNMNWNFNNNMNQNNLNNINNIGNNMNNFQMNNNMNGLNNNIQFPNNNINIMQNQPMNMSNNII